VVGYQVGAPGARWERELGLGPGHCCDSRFGWVELELGR
jgi:hypothetical protein